MDTEFIIKDKLLLESISQSFGNKKIDLIINQNIESATTIPDGYDAIIYIADNANITSNETLSYKTFETNYVLLSLKNGTSEINFCGVSYGDVKNIKKYLDDCIIVEADDYDTLVKTFYENMVNSIVLPETLAKQMLEKNSDDKIIEKRELSAKFFVVIIYKN